MFGSILSPESDSLNKSWAAVLEVHGHHDQVHRVEHLRVRPAGQGQRRQRPRPRDHPAARVCSTQMVLTGKVKKPPAQTVTNENAWSAGLEDLRHASAAQFYAAPMSANMKSLVWYSPKYFAAHNYTVPTTWKDLMALSNKIATDNNGAKPWCGGINSGTASGWPATDWLEEAVLGYATAAQVYDQWIAHKVKFDSAADPECDEHRQGLHAEPEVGERRLRRRAVHRHHDVPERRSADPEEQVRDAAAGLVLRGAVAEGHDRVVRPATCIAFYLPAVNPSIPTPVEGGGEFVTAFSSDPAVQAVQNYVSSPRMGRQPDQGRAGLGVGEPEGRPGALHRPDRQAVREVPGRPERHVPLRRLGRHAGRGRLRARSGRPWCSGSRRAARTRRSRSRSTRPGRSRPTEIRYVESDARRVRSGRNDARTAPGDGRPTSSSHDSGGARSWARSTS